MEDWAQRVKALKAAQHRQVMQVELHLETTPRDSRFSAALLDLMKKHDATPKDAANAAAIGQRCDEMLKQETRAFFAKVVAANTRKWQTLRGKLEEERKTIRYPVGASLQSASAHSKPGGVTAADLDREAERLEIDYHQNWFKYESLHLQEAFQSQALKIDHEWNAHEQALLNEFNERRERIAGTQRQSPSHSLSPIESGGDRRWHHPEKQSTLIHTAPVLTPTRPQSQSQRRSSAAFGELAKVERDYEEALAELQQQKADAKRWLARQQIRFAAQCEELRKEKLVVVQILEDILNEFPLLG